MRAAAATATLVALLTVPAASAKTLTRVVALGAGGTSVTLRGLDWSALRVADAVVPKDNRYLLLYPLMERGIPAQPGRFFPAEHVACYSWNRSVAGDCWTLADSLTARLSRLPLLTGPPTVLRSLTVAGRSGNLNSNGAVAIELALARRDLMRPAKSHSKPCVGMSATWTGSDGALRPTHFLSCPKGLWAAGKLYPAGPLLGI
jgi:hypothetical protein